MTLLRATEPHVVYRVYDADDVLLYVGCTYDLPKRMANHRQRSSWWPFAARVEQATYPAFGTAAWHEARAIMTERPVFNLQQRSIPFTQARAERDAYLAARAGVAA